MSLAFESVLYKLDNLVCPYVHKILVDIEPLLIDEDYYAQVEDCEIILNLLNAVGLAHMILTMQPDINHADKCARNTTACAFLCCRFCFGDPFPPSLP